MTDHLPECPLLEPCDDEVADHGYCSMQHGVFCIHCQQWCICDRLRVCEQRKDEEWQRTLKVKVQYAMGFNDGLDAAKDAAKSEALMALVLTSHASNCDGQCLRCSLESGCECGVLGFIDAFREEL